MKSVITLWKREIIRFYRQPSRILGAVGSPIIFWLFIGSGVGASFSSGEAIGLDNYNTYFFPGVLMLILLFTSIFSTISIIEDRKEGFLQAVLVSPVSRSSIVLGKVLGGMTIAFFQSLLFLCLAPFAGLSFGGEQISWLLGLLLLNGFTLTSLGFFIAWQFKSIQGFHAVMNLLLLPMWILSGALFPLEGASAWIQILMKLNPLYYGMKGLHGVVLMGGSIQIDSIIITFVFGIILFIFSTLVASKRKHQKFGLMMKKSTIVYLFLSTLLAGFFLWGVSHYHEAKRQSKTQTDSEVLGSVPQFQLQDQDGKLFENNNLEGKFWIANFVFTRCAGPCPLMTQQMRSLQNKLGADRNIHFVSFTVDPEYDSPEILTKYAKKYDANLENWSFLTGEKEEIFQLAIQHFYLGVGEVPPEEIEAKDQHVWHSTKFVLINGQHQIIGYFDSGSEIEMNALFQKASGLYKA